MILSYVFLLVGIFMLNRRVYLYMAPVLIGISWRFGQVTAMRSFTVDEMLIVLSSIKIVQYMIIRRFEYRMPVMRWHLIYLLGVGFTFLIGLILFQSYDRATFNDIILLHFKQRVYLPIVFAAVYVLVQDTEEGLKLLRWSALLAVPVCLYGIIQYHYYVIPRVGDFGSFWLYSWYDEREFWRVFSYRRSFGTFGHPAPFGRYLMFIVILNLTQGIHSLDGKRPWRTGLVLALLAFYTMGTTGSRGPMLGLGLAVATIVYLERKSFSRNLLIIIVSSLAFFYAVPQVMTERIDRAVEEGTEEMSIATRFIMWSTLTDEVLTDNPISGYGPKYEVCYDNDYVSIIYEGGLLLLVLFSFWILSIFQLGSVGVQSESQTAQMCGVIVLGSLVAILIAAFTGRSFFSPKVGMEFIFVIALCAKMIVLTERERGWRYYEQISEEREQ